MAASAADKIVFALPGVPMGKGRPRIVRRGKMVSMHPPESTKSFEGELKLFCAIAMRGREPFERGVSLRLTIRARMPVAESHAPAIKRRMLAGEIRPTSKPDLDNIGKIVGDALNHVAWHDDSQIVELIATKVYSAKPELVVEIEPVGAAVLSRRPAKAASAGPELPLPPPRAPVPDVPTQPVPAPAPRQQGPLPVPSVRRAPPAAKSVQSIEAPAPTARRPQPRLG